MSNLVIIAAIAAGGFIGNQTSWRGLTNPFFVAMLVAYIVTMTLSYYGRNRR